MELHLRLQVRVGEQAGADLLEARVRRGQIDARHRHVVAGQRNARRLATGIHGHRARDMAGWHVLGLRQRECTE